MPRVTDAEVRVLIPSTTILDLTPFIISASLLVDQLSASSCGQNLVTAQLEEVERWLSAHFASISDPYLNITEETFEDAKNKYNKGSAPISAGLMSTTFGQMANTLSNGCLAELDKPLASFVTG